MPYIEAEERAQVARWESKGQARVTHETHGSIVVPCGSKYAALLCAADYWRCDWLDIRGATVMAAEPGAIPVKPPRTIHYK